MNNWLAVAKVYSQPRILGILLLGFSSGLPFLLTLGTLHAWLKASGTSNTTIGYFALATLPYAFKFLWAPLTDHLRLPVLSEALGTRRAWILVSQIGLIFMLVLLGSTDPVHSIETTALAAFGVSFFASCQDNAIEAYRIEILPKEMLGPGAGACVLGFRLGMWVAGGGALYLAYFFNNWFLVYTLMASCVGLGMLANVMLPKPDEAARCQTKGLVNRIKTHTLPSLIDYVKSPNFGHIIIFIFLFKIGDTVLNMISIPFLIEIGFSNLEIANIAKTFGIVAMILGGLFSGILLTRRSMAFNLTLGAGMVTLSCMMFMIQAHLGHNTSFLILTMGIENFACGMSATALIAYLSSLCEKPNIATHFALLSSFCSLSRVGLSIGAGRLADQTPWVNYFAIIGCLSVLCLIWLAVYHRQLFTNSHQIAEA